MKHIKKRVLSLILVMVMLLSMLPISVSAAYDYLFPVNNGGAIAYYYGYSASYGSWHGGIDIHATSDDTIYAAYDGVVGATANSCSHVSCGYKCAHYNTYGNYIRIDQDDGTKAYYGHLLKDSLLVSVGTRVTKGQAIAKMGSSGYSTGKHLHFEIRVGSEKINVNPTSSSGSVNYSYSGYGGSDSSSTTPSYTYTALSESNYNIINKSSGLYLNAFAEPGTAKSGTNICVSNADNSAEQKFKIQHYGNNQYYIRSLSNANEFCVNAESGSVVKSGANVSLYKHNTVPSKLWYFEDVGDGYYIIRNVMNENLVLTAVSDVTRSNVCVKAYSASDLQKWQLVNLSATNTGSITPSTNASTVSESKFNIISKSSGNYLNAFANAGQATSSNVSFGTGSMMAGLGTDVCVSNADGSMEQQWRLQHSGDNKYYIRSLSNSGLYCVNAYSPNNVVSDGADVRLYNFNDVPSKLWYFESDGNGYYVIRNVMNTNLVLTAVDNNNRADVIVKSYTGYDNQKWKLVDLNATSAPAVQYSYIDLNCYYNNTEYGNMTGVATADVYINGTLVADDVNDFYAQYPEGTKYEIRDVKVSDGYSYVGIYSGELTGTVGTSKISACLHFEKLDSKFEPSEIDVNKVYSIVNKSAGTYLNAFAKDGKVTVQTNVCASNGDNSNEQKFKLQSVGDSKYLIRSLSNANLYCVDVYTPSNVAEDGANVWMYYNTDFASKHWYFESVGDGYYIIRNALNTNLVLTAVDNNHRANVIVKTYMGYDNQKWKLETLNESSSSNEAATQNENIQKLNSVLRKWVNVDCTFDLDVSTSKTQVIDYNNPPVTMDCSSFTSSIYLTVFGVDIGRNTRVQQYRGAPVGIDKAKNQDYSDLQIGDLILFDWGKDGVPDHVGIYSGNGNYIHMTTSNKVVENSFSYKNRYANILTIRRIIQQDGSLYPWPYTSQGDDEVMIFASAAVVNNTVSYSFDKDEQTITNIPADCTYGELLLNTEYDKMVVLNSNGGNIITITRDEVTIGEFVENDAVVLNGTIANFYDSEGNLVFVGECIVDGEVDITLYGDVNGDGEIDERDAMAINKYIVGWNIEINLVAADTYKDGEIDERDSMNIKKLCVGWDIELG